MHHGSVRAGSGMHFPRGERFIGKRWRAAANRCEFAVPGDGLCERRMPRLRECAAARRRSRDELS